MQLSDLENMMHLGQALWLVGIYIVRRDRLWEEADYISFEDYAQRRWGVSRRRADQWASAGEIVLDLEPGLDPEAPEAANQGTNGSLMPPGRPGAAFSERRLRPLLGLKRDGFPPADLREVWTDVLAHTIDPTEKNVKATVIKRKREALQGMCSPQGAENLRRLIALHVYDLVRAESDSDELAVLCREAITSVLRDFADEGDEAEIDARQGSELLGIA